MLICLFCPTPLGDKTRLEHPVLKRIGGRLKRRDLICDKCNEDITAAADTPLAEALTFPCFSLCVRSGDGDDPPTLRRLETEHGVMDLAPDSAVKTKVTYSAPELNAAGIMTGTIDARSIDEVAEQIAHLARRLNVKTLEEFDARLRLPDQIFLDKTPFSQPINTSFNIGGTQHWRSMAKTAIEILALHDREAAQSVDLEGARRFVRHGEGPDRGILQLNPGPSVPFTLEELGQFAHVISVWADPGSPMVAHVTLFGFFHFGILLAEGWDGAAIAVSHAVDPLAERHFGLRQFATRPSRPNIAHFSPVPLDVEVWRDRQLIPFMTAAHAVGKRRTIEWTVRKRAKAIIGDQPLDAPVSDEHAAQLEGLVVDIALTAQKIPQREPLDRNDVIRKARDAFVRLSKRI
jgi:hypothetical protein